MEDEQREASFVDEHELKGTGGSTAEPPSRQQNADAMAEGDGGEGLPSQSTVRRALHSYVVQYLYGAKED